MSCDFGVWSSRVVLDDLGATSLYESLCEGDLSATEPDPRVDSFYAELVAKHPEIDDIPESELDNHDLCPWSIAFDRSPGHLIICCVWSRADYVAAHLAALARKHEVVLYDPQAERIIHPESPPRPSKWKFWQR